MLAGRSSVGYCAVGDRLGASVARVVRGWRKSWPKSSTLMGTRRIVRVDEAPQADRVDASGRDRGINLTKDEKRMADARIIRFRGRILAEVDSGRARQLDLWLESGGNAEGWWSIEVKAALIACARGRGQVAGEGGCRRLETVGSMTIVPAGPHISSDEVGGKSLCAVACDSVIASGSFPFELDLPVAPTVGDGEGEGVEGGPDEATPAEVSRGEELREASWLAETVAIERLLEAGADPAERDEQGFATNHYAAASGDAAVNTCLHAQGASM
jgi:hypothetical protein